MLFNIEWLVGGFEHWGNSDIYEQAGLLVATSPGPSVPSVPSILLHVVGNKEPGATGGGSRILSFHIDRGPPDSTWKIRPIPRQVVSAPGCSFDPLLAADPEGGGSLWAVEDCGNARTAVRLAMNAEGSLQIQRRITVPEECHRRYTLSALDDVVLLDCESSSKDHRALWIREDLGHLEKDNNQRPDKAHKGWELFERDRRREEGLPADNGTAAESWRKRSGCHGNGVTTASLRTNSALGSTQAHDGDTVTLEFSAVEPFASPVVILAGHNVTNTLGSSGAGSYSVTWTLGAGDAEGLVSWRIEWAGGSSSSPGNGAEIMFAHDKVPNVTLTAIARRRATASWGLWPAPAVYAAQNRWIVQWKADGGSYTDGAEVTEDVWDVNLTDLPEGVVIEVRLKVTNGTAPEVLGPSQRWELPQGLALATVDEVAPTHARVHWPVVALQGTELAGLDDQVEYQVLAREVSLPGAGGGAPVPVGDGNWTVVSAPGRPNGTAGDWWMRVDAATAPTAGALQPGHRYEWKVRARLSGAGYLFGQSDAGSPTAAPEDVESSPTAETVVLPEDLGQPTRQALAEDDAVTGPGVRYHVWARCTSCAGSPAAVRLTGPRAPTRAPRGRAGGRRAHDGPGCDCPAGRAERHLQLGGQRVVQPETAASWEMPLEDLALATVDEVAPRTPGCTGPWWLQGTELAGLDDQVEYQVLARERPGAAP
ncbi:hypothetical protein PAPYR_13146 [Paratrimastix pyriformis]|uniref:Fibronectin type-III domain-containing protein n=1 Tax=Paratrimastix pyriformis TaxID=342808 RepID=A0ABQ8U0R2_9EUKA|nr:hypothetical protein PAPYR_13146 [Paratrimastix pyriformis]